MRVENGSQRLDHTDETLPGRVGAVGRVGSGGLLHPVDLRSDPSVIGIHLVQQVAGSGIARPHDGPQTPIFADMVAVQEFHQPLDMGRDGHPLPLKRGRRRRERPRGPLEVAA